MLFINTPEASQVPSAGSRALLMRQARKLRWRLLLPQGTDLSWIQLQRSPQQPPRGPTLDGSESLRGLAKVGCALPFRACDSVLMERAWEHAFLVPSDAAVAAGPGTTFRESLLLTLTLIRDSIWKWPRWPTGSTTLVCVCGCVGGNGSCLPQSLEWTQLGLWQVIPLLQICFPTFEWRGNPWGKYKEWWMEEGEAVAAHVTPTWNAVGNSRVWQAWTEMAVGPLCDTRQVGALRWASKSFSFQSWGYDT